MSDPEKICILIAGMHRSGTSACAGLLARLGADIGNSLIRENASNPEGYWEHAKAVSINDQLLENLGLTWHSVLPMPADWRETASAKVAKEAIKELLREDFADSSLCVVKDPRISRLVPLWIEAAVESGFSPRIILSVRHPDEVHQSLARRDGTAPEVARWLWQAYNLECFLNASEHPFVVIPFAHLIDSPARQIDRIKQQLGVDFESESDRVSDVAATFVVQSLRHHHAESTDRRTDSLADIYCQLESLNSNDDVAVSRLRDKSQDWINSSALTCSAIQPPRKESTDRPAPSAIDLLPLFVAPLYGDDVAAVYWRSSAEGFDESRSRTTDLLRYSRLTQLRVEIPCEARPDYLRIDPSVYPGMFRLRSLRIDGREFGYPRDAITRVNGHLLVCGDKDLCRVFCNNTDPYVEIDLSMLEFEVSESVPLLIEVEIMKDSMLDDLFSQLESVASSLRSQP